MIHVESLALNSTLVDLGLSDESLQLARGTIAMLKLDPYACSYHAMLEDQLLSLMENAALIQQGLLCIDEVIAAATVLSRTLSRLSNHYRHYQMYDRADRVLNLARGLTESLKWA
jgi:hypothetical protein